MRTNKPYVQVTFTPGNTCRHQLGQGGIPAVAWLHIKNTRLGSLILPSVAMHKSLLSFRPGKVSPDTLPCAISREMVT